MKPQRSHFLACLLVLSLAGCAAPRSQPGPGTETTAAPAATVTVPPSPGPGSGTPSPEASATPGQAAVETPVPLPIPPVTILPGRSPTPTRTPKPQRALIEILSPGPFSKVVDGLSLQAYARPGGDHRIGVTLVDETGRTLYESHYTYTTPLDSWAFAGDEIAFDLPLAALFARLQVTTQDEFGRLMAVGSVHLILLSDGYDEINPPGSLAERVTLVRPGLEAEIGGGLLIVEGKYSPAGAQPLQVELLDEAGNILASRSIPIPAAGGTAPFVADLAYSLAAQSRARLSLYQMDDRLPGIFYLYSREVLLDP
ncbi:MAG: hypothetical protein FJZ96_02685 [Chloroflexi bacterium]|nr:hypothetical protein [Chloroflexota bacterium]